MRHRQGLSPEPLHWCLSPPCVSAALESVEGRGLIVQTFFGELSPAGESLAVTSWSSASPFCIPTFLNLFSSPAALCGVVGDEHNQGVAGDTAVTYPALGGHKGVPQSLFVGFGIWTTWETTELWPCWPSGWWLWLSQLGGCWWITPITDRPLPGALGVSCIQVTAGTGICSFPDHAQVMSPHRAEAGGST